MTTRRDSSDEPAETGSPVTIVWNVETRRDDLVPEALEARDALADAARGGEWNSVEQLLRAYPTG